MSKEQLKSEAMKKGSAVLNFIKWQVGFYLAFELLGNYMSMDIFYNWYYFYDDAVDILREDRLTDMQAAWIPIIPHHPFGISQEPRNTTLIRGFVPTGRKRKFRNMTKEEEKEEEEEESSDDED